MSVGTQSLEKFAANGLAAQGAVDAIAATANEFRIVPIDKIIPSPTNPRKTRDEGKMQELVESVAAHGVLQPILVRPLKAKYFVSGGIGKVRYLTCLNLVGHPNLLETFSHGTASENEAKAQEAADRKNALEPDYEIVFGERRWRAAKIANCGNVPVRVRELSDQQVLELQLIENLNREDVHPLEEAAGFESLIDNYGYTPSAIAEKVGCSESYVHKRLRLARLIEPARKSFSDGVISLNHAILIARLEPEQQKHAFGLCIREHWDHVINKKTKQAIPASVLDARIKTEILLDLSAAPWKKDDAQLVPKAGACTVCPKRTGSNAQLFDDFKKGDHCLDRECFEKKRQAFVDIKSVELAAKTGQEPVRLATTYADDKTLKKLNAVREHSFTEVKGKKDHCGSVETAIVVYGNDVGHTREICRDGKCKKHHPHAAGSNYGQTPQAIAAERKRKTDEKIDAAYRRELWLRTWGGLDVPLRQAEVDLVAEYLIERIGHDARGPLVKVLGIEPAKKSTGGFADNAKAIRGYYTKLDSKKKLCFLVALSLAPAISNFMHSSAAKEMESIAKPLGLNPVAIRKAVAEPILEAAKKRVDNEKKKAAVAKKSVKTNNKEAKQRDWKRAAAGDEPEIEDADPVDYDTEWHEGADDAGI